MAAEPIGPRHEGPPYVIVSTGHTTRGWPWFVIRKRGGARRRVTVNGEHLSADGVAAAIDRAVTSMPDSPHIDNL